MKDIITITATESTPTIILDILKEYNGIQATHETVAKMAEDIKWIFKNYPHVVGSISYISYTGLIADIRKGLAFSVEITWIF